MTENATGSLYLSEERGTYAATREDVLALLEHAGGRRGMTAIRGRALILLLWATGARMSEALAMLNADLDLGEPMSGKAHVRLWRAKKRPEGRPRGAKERAAWEQTREAQNRARVERLREAMGAKDPQARIDLARLELVALHRRSEPWDVLDRGKPSRAVLLSGEDRHAAADALRSWRRVRAKLPGGRTDSAPLWASIRATSRTLSGGQGKAGAPLTGSSFRAWLAKIGERAGIGEKVRRLEGETTGRGRVVLHPHHIRHGAAVREWVATRDLQSVRAFCGHESQVTTETYLRGLGALASEASQPQETALERALAELPPELRAVLAETLTRGGA